MSRDSNLISLPRVKVSNRVMAKNEIGKVNLKQII